MEPYTTPNLYHFVGHRSPSDHKRNTDILRSILKNKCITSDPHDFTWGDVRVTIDETKSLAKGELVVPGMVCFCDIPPKALGLHMGKYGRCGIALKRDHLVRYQARPVTYFPYDPSDNHTVGGLTQLKDIEVLMRALVGRAPGRGHHTRTIGAPPRGDEQLLAHAMGVFGRDFLAFLKPFDATAPSDCSTNYYMEREWRRLGNMRFEPENVAWILVPAEFVAPLKDEFPEYAGAIEDTHVHANPPG